MPCIENDKTTTGLHYYLVKLFNCGQSCILVNVLKFRTLFSLGSEIY